MNDNDLKANAGQTLEANSTDVEETHHPADMTSMPTVLTNTGTGGDGPAGNVPTRSRWRRWGLVVIDILLFVAFHMVLTVALMAPFFIKSLAKEGEIHKSPHFIIQELISLVTGLAAVYIVLRIRRLPWSGVGLTLRAHWRDFGAGILLAVALYAVGFGICLATGSVGVTGCHFSLADQAMSLLLFLMVAIYEETVSRGFLLGRMIDGGVHRLWALLLSSLLFSSMHLMNPNFALLPFINIVLAGILLGASYIYTRNLALPIALHWFWNYLQGPILGFEVSGTRLTKDMLTLRLSGSDLISGGNFGFEGSLTCTVLMLLAIAGVMAWKRREEKCHNRSEASEGN